VFGVGLRYHGVEECDDGDMDDSDYCSNSCILQGYPQCYESDYGVLNGDPWVICSVDGNTAWVSANTGGTYNALAICQFLGFTTVAQKGGTCGNVCGYCEGPTDCMNHGQMNFDNGGGNGQSLSHTVQWLCSN